MKLFLKNAKQKTAPETKGFLSISIFQNSLKKSKLCEEDLTELYL